MSDGTMDTTVNTTSRALAGFALRPLQLGVLFACIALVLYLAFVSYVDSDIEKQARQGHYSFLAAIATVPMVLGLLQYMPLVTQLEEWFFPSGRSAEAQIVAAMLIAVAYFGAGAWAAHVLRGVVVSSRKRQIAFYFLAFLGTALILSSLGGAWLFVACRTGSC